MIQKFPFQRHIIGKFCPLDPRRRVEATSVTVCHVLVYFLSFFHLIDTESLVRLVDNKGQVPPTIHLSLFAKAILTIAVGNATSESFLDDREFQ
jgi:hypothetical protein